MRTRRLKWMSLLCKQTHTHTRAHKHVRPLKHTQTHAPRHSHTKPIHTGLNNTHMYTICTLHKHTHAHTVSRSHKHTLFGLNCVIIRPKEEWWGGYDAAVWQVWDSSWPRFQFSSLLRQKLSWKSFTGGLLRLPSWSLFILVLDYYNIYIYIFFFINCTR